MTVLRFCLVLVALAGCVSRAGVPDAAGLTGIHTRQTVLTDEVHHVLLGHVIIARDDHRIGRALVITHRRDGVHALRVARASTGTGALDWRPLPYARDSCGPRDCRDRVLGMIVLSDTMLTQAARLGLRARLTGSVGPIAIYAPPQMFRDAIALASAQGI